MERSIWPCSIRFTRRFGVVIRMSFLHAAERNPIKDEIRAVECSQMQTHLLEDFSPSVFSLALALDSTNARNFLPCARSQPTNAQPGPQTELLDMNAARVDADRPG